MEQTHLFMIPLYMIIPFVLMLGCIAIMPLFAEKFWEHNKNKLIIALALGIPTAAWMIVNGLSEHVIHTVFFDYIPFIILLGGLFVITGGIFIDAEFQPTPRNNTLILIAGTLLASFMGTTGAAMLLIRLLLKMNKQRQFKVHTVLFFIACVANCGGLLTPLGDPPLFMMYLRGVDFFWFFNSYQQWLFVNGMLLVIYFIYDNYYWKRESQEIKEKEVKEKEELKENNINENNITVPSPIKISGKINFVWLLVVIFAVAFLNPNMLPFMKTNPLFGYMRDGIIVLAAIMSLITTKKEQRKANDFNWYPIFEVAFLFIGIFLTMIPVLEILHQNASQINITTPTAFYFVTGGLSSVLDNTPTAVTFYSLAEGVFSGSTEYVNIVAGIPDVIMKAICLGAVFFGSITYIGNAPNFMVKSIAEQNGISMPQFFQYMIKFSLIIILPVLVLCNFIFF